MEELSLKHIESFTGIKAHTIRIWEQRYNFFESKRTQSNRRYFTPQDLNQILNICFLNQQGYKLCDLDGKSVEEIKQLVDENILKDPEKSTLQKLLISTIQMNLSDFEQRIDRLIEEQDFIYIVLDYIWPYINKIQKLHCTGLITPRHEHLFLEILKRKLYYQIESLKGNSEDSKSALLYCIEGEYKDMKLLSLQYMLLNHGIDVYYLGSSLPDSEISCLSQRISPDYIVVQAEGGVGKTKNLKSNLKLVEKYFPKSKVFLTGELAKNLKLDNFSDIMSVTSSDEVKKMLNSLTK